MNEEGFPPKEAVNFVAPEQGVEGAVAPKPEEPKKPEPQPEKREFVEPITATNYYEILGVGANATEQEIKDAYRKLAMVNHSDRNPGGPNAEANIRKINEANSILSKPDKRAEYDAKLKSGEGGGRATRGTASSNPVNVTAPAQPDRAEEFWNGVFGGFVNGGTAGTRSDSGRQSERGPKASELGRSGSKVEIRRRADGTYYLEDPTSSLSLGRNNLNRHAEIKQMAGLFVGKNRVGYYPISAKGEPIGLFAWERVATDKDGRFLVLRDPRNFNGGERIDGQNVGVFNRPDFKKGTKGEVKVFAEYLENDTGLKMARTGKYFVLLGKHTGQTLNELADEYTEISFGTIKATRQPSSAVWGRKNQNSPWEVIVANYNQT